MKFEIFSGKLKFKDIDFDFVFDCDILRLIIPKDKQSQILSWIGRKTEGGIEINAPSDYIDEQVISGSINETGSKIVFITEKQFLGHFNFEVLTIMIKYYIITSFDANEFNIISFKCPEIDYIYPKSNAIASIDWSKSGLVSVQTKHFSELASKKQTFTVDNKCVKAFFGQDISSNNMRNRTAPIDIKSVMYFEFEKSSDYMFLMRLCQIAKSFLQYLCYTKNIWIPEINIYTNLSGRNVPFAIMYTNHENNYNNDSIKNRGYIKQQYISGYEGKILNDIASNKLYLRHIPYGYTRHYDPASFVMITAAFEWEFKQCYPKGIVKDEKQIAAENKVTIALLKLKNQGKNDKYLKKYINFY